MLQEAFLVPFNLTHFQSVGLPHDNEDLNRLATCLPIYHQDRANQILKLEASEDRRKRNKQFFMGRILILVIGLNQI